MIGITYLASTLLRMHPDAIWIHSYGVCGNSVVSHPCFCYNAVGMFNPAGVFGLEANVQTQNVGDPQCVSEEKALMRVLKQLEAEVEWQHNIVDDVCERLSPLLTITDATSANEPSLERTGVQYADKIQEQIEILALQRRTLQDVLRRLGI